MNEVLKRIGELKLVPVVVLDSVEHAMPLADALVSGGLPIAEVTFRTDAAEQAIRVMAGRGDLLVGAGTVLNVAQADRAIDGGATFIVAPGTSPQVVEHCLSRGVAVTPGVATPTDIELGLSLGLETFKYFPAEVLGGVRALKAVSAPYRGVQFLPTGGISLQNLRDYLQLPNVLACGGSWLAAGDKLASGDFVAIEAGVKQAVDLLQ